MHKALKTLTWTLASVLGLGLIVGILALTLASRFGMGQTQDMQVWLTTVQAGDLTETLSAPGQVQAITKIEISARVSARILELPHGEGSLVTAGNPTAQPPVGSSVLIELDASDLRAQLEAAEKRRDSLVASIAVDHARIRGMQAQQTSANSALQEAKRNLKRQTQLQRSGDVSNRVVEDTRQAHASANAAAASADASLQAAKLGLEVSGFNIASAEADIQRLRDNLAYTTIRSPIDGIVTRVNVEVGEIAVTGTMNNPGTVLLEVADLSGLVAIARVDETHVNRVQPGQTAHVRISAYPQDVFKGTVQRVALATSPQGSGAAGSAYFETRIRLDELPSPIRTGLTASVDIESATYTNVLLVPNQSVISVPVESLAPNNPTPNEQSSSDPTTPKKTTYNVGGRSTTLAVYTVRKGKAVLIPVEIGASDNNNTLILAGLKAGDTVISGPFATLSQLHQDTPVRVTRRDGIPVISNTTTPPQAADDNTGS